MPVLLKRTLITLLIIIVVLAILVAGFVWNKKQSQPQMFVDPVTDVEPPVLGEMSHAFKLLSFSKTGGFRHHDAIPAGNQLLADLAEENNWSVAFTENAAVFNAKQLAQFDVVIFNNVTKPNLTADQQQEFESYINSGGGFVGVHAAGDGSHKDWDWYANQVIRAKFTMHPMWPQLQEATLNLDVRHPVSDGLPEQWTATDEWYSFEESVRSTGTQVLVTIDESTYDPNKWPMGDDHPLVWAHELEQGRVVYSALGHTKESYRDKNHQRLLEQAIVWAASN